MFTRRVDFHWETPNPTVFYDVLTNNVVVMNYRTAEELVEEFGGKITYCSQTGLTGDGYAYLPYTFIKIGSFRHNQKGEIIDVYEAEETIDLPLKIYVETQHQAPTGKCLIGYEAMLCYTSVSNIAKVLKMAKENRDSDEIAEALEIPSRKITYYDTELEQCTFKMFTNIRNPINIFAIKGYYKLPTEEALEDYGAIIDPIESVFMFKKAALIKVEDNKYKVITYRRMNDLEHVFITKIREIELGQDYDIDNISVFDNKIVVSFNEYAIMFKIVDDSVFIKHISRDMLVNKMIDGKKMEDVINTIEWEMIK